MDRLSSEGSKDFSKIALIGISINQFIFDEFSRFLFKLMKRLLHQNF